MKPFFDLLRGWSFPPISVALARGSIAAVLLAGIVIGGHAMGILSWEDWAKATPVILFLFRLAEGGADRAIDPQQNATAERRAANPPQ